MTFRVVFVCAANICRSPTAAKLFESHLPASLEHVVKVQSVGMFAMPGQPWCQDAQKWIRRHKVVVKDAAHRSRRLTAVNISQTHLILAADTEIKSAVLRADLQVRPRLFTLVEATNLAAGVQGALADSLAGRVNWHRLQLEPLPRLPGDARMAWLVDEMDAARGLIVPHGRDARARAVDVLDAHASGARTSHRSTLRQLYDAVASLAHSMGLVDIARN